MAQPLVYACSGCSSAAQLANHVAVRLDREGLAEMSCIAGLGGDVPALLRTARKAVAARRAVLAIDGCVLACTRQTLARHGITPTHHVQLWRMGVRKRPHEDFSAEEADEAWGHCRAIVAETATPGLELVLGSRLVPAPAKAPADTVAAPPAPMSFSPRHRDDATPALPAAAMAARVTLMTAATRRVGRALAALRSYGSAAVPSRAVRGLQDPDTRF